LQKRNATERKDFFTEVLRAGRQSCMAQVERTGDPLLERCAARFIIRSYVETEGSIMKPVYAIPTPLGTMHAIEENGKVIRLLLPGFAAPALEGSPQTNLAQELTEYFEGKRNTFSVPISVEGTVFFQRLWQAALAIPYGRTITYGELASAAGRPEASRAAGQAMASNPLPILIPCHRVVYSHGKTQSYLGGAEMKEFLLSLEKGNA
jgi:methylated-DNA-[protein]-cysteine S-methyltransferase